MCRAAVIPRSLVQKTAMELMVKLCKGASSQMETVAVLQAAPCFLALLKSSSATLVNHTSQALASVVLHHTARIPVPRHGDKMTMSEQPPERQWHSKALLKLVKSGLVAAWLSVLEGMYPSCPVAFLVVGLTTAPSLGFLTCRRCRFQ